MKSPMVLSVVAFLLSIGVHQIAAAPARSEGWTRYVNERGTEVEYPARLFSVQKGPEPMGVGERFATADGRARLSIFAMENPERGSPAQFISKHLKVPKAALSYDRVARMFFAVSGYVGSDVYYSRCNLSEDRSTFHCVTLNYPKIENTSWDSIVTRISLSLRPLVSS